MKIGKNVALMAAGAAMAVAYQKYSKPMMKSLEKTINKVSKNAEKSLEDMI